MSYDYGVGPYGLVPYGGSVSEDSPVIVSTVPAIGSIGVALDAPVAITFSALDIPDVNSFSLTVNGVDVLVDGVWADGWDGILDWDGSGWVLTITSHPDFDFPKISFVVFYAGDYVGSFSFSVELTAAAFTSAKTYCGGKKITLNVSYPSNVHEVRILRSKYAYASFPDDPGDVIHEGPLTGGVLVDDGLEEGTFYYYTIFTRYSASGKWDASAESRVQGLSIRDYLSSDGHYVYKLLPRAMRDRDATAEKPYELRTLCLGIQCVVNLVRGYTEGLLLFRDPDRSPAGMTGLPELQTSILSAYVSDLGFSPEQSFDAGVLRRLVLALVPAFSRRGTCNGLSIFASAFSKWQVSACVDEGKPRCGRRRFASTWSREGLSARAYTSSVTEEPTPDLSVAVADVVMNIGFTAIKKTVLKITGQRGDFGEDGLDQIAPLNASLYATMLTDAFGGAVCVSAITEDSGYWVFQHTDPDSYLRDTIRCEVIGTHPNQEVQALERGWNADDGYLVIYSDIFSLGTITADGGSPQLLFFQGVGDVDGKHQISTAATVTLGGATLKREHSTGPHLYQGNGSLSYDYGMDEGYLEDYDLFSSLSVLSAAGGRVGTYAPGSRTTRLVFSGVATKFEITGMGIGYIEQGTAYTPNELIGSYLVPNVFSGQVFQIVANTATKIYVQEVDGEPAVSDVARVGTLAVILSPSDALKFQQLYRLLGQMTQMGHDVLLDFA